MIDGFGGDDVYTSYMLMGDEEFVIITMWPHQEQNGAYHARLKAWGTSFRFKEDAQK